MKIIKPQVLIISTKFDFSTDNVVYHLNKNRINYLRINRDQFNEYKIFLNPIDRILYLSKDNITYIVSTKNLKSIYFRAPTFLREIFKNVESPLKQLNITQWSAFIRALIVFEDAKWVNNPINTYKAENKSYQLYIANKIGFKVPKSLITNFFDENNLPDKSYAVKTLDTGIINKKNKQAFIYTEFYSSKTLLKRAKSKFPIILQTSLLPKEDIRITVIGKSVYAVKIIGNEATYIDWRKQKSNLIYSRITLPSEIKYKCLKLVRKLDLLFGAIDMIKQDNNYYFIEINPTGEWAWIEKHLNFGIDKRIAELLSSKK